MGNREPRRLLVLNISKARCENGEQTREAKQDTSLRVEAIEVTNPLEDLTDIPATLEYDSTRFS